MTYESPLKGYENAEPLPDTINPDGKSLYNPPGPPSAAYDEFPAPIDPSNNGFDFHSMFYFSVYADREKFMSRHVVYYMQSVPSQLEFAKQLHERIRREFPEVSLTSCSDLCPTRASFFVV